MQGKRIKFDPDKVDPPKKTFFFRIGDGKPFATEEKEAWEILQSRGNWRRKDVEYLGTSDGAKYYEALIEATKIRAPKHECTLREEGSCGFCTDATDEAKDIIRAGFDAEVEEAGKNKERPGNQDVYFMGNMTKAEKGDIKSQLT